MALDYDRLAADYASHRKVQPVLLAALLQGAQPTRDTVVAEVGCGTGNYIGAVQAAVGCTCWGVEPSAAMLTTARRRWHPVHFVQAPAETLDLPAASVDFIFSVDVIHHVGDVAAYFRAAAQALRPGGRICTATDAPEMIARRRPLAAYFPGTVAADLARYPTPATLEHAMTAAGLVHVTAQEVEYIYPLCDAAPIRARAYSCLHLISDEEFHAGLARMEEDLESEPIDVLSEYLLLWAQRPG